MRLRIRETRIRIETLEYEKKILVSAGAATNSTLVKVQIEKDNLEKDLAQHQVENTALKTYFGEVREGLRQMLEASSALYRSNLALLNKIERLSMTASLTRGKRATSSRSAFPSPSTAPTRPTATGSSACECAEWCRSRWEAVRSRSLPLKRAQINCSYWASQEGSLLFLLLLLL